MSKRIMLGNHNSNRNKPHTQYRHEQQNTNYIDESLQSVLKIKTNRTQRNPIMKKGWKKNPRKNYQNCKNGSI